MPATGYAGADSFGWNGTDGTAYATSPASVNLMVDPAWLGTGSAATWNAGTQTLTINSGNVTINADPGALGDVPNIIASGNANVVVNTGGNGAEVNLGSLTLAGNATLDVQNNVVLVGNTAADPVSTIQSYIAGGQVFSSSLNASSNYGIGYSTVTVGNTTESEFRYDIKGDTNLDGTVNNTDLTTVPQNLGLSTNLWSLGNFEYNAGSSNATVNNSDLTDVLQNLGLAMPSAGVISASTASTVQTNATVVDATAIQTTVAVVATPLVAIATPGGDQISALVQAVSAATPAATAAAAKPVLAPVAAGTPATAAGTMADTAIGADELYLGVSYQPMFAD